MQKLRYETGSWTDVSVKHIERIVSALPSEMPLKDKLKAIDASYPFMWRRGWAYQAWLKARRSWISRNDPMAAERERQKLKKLTGQKDLLWP